MINNENIIIRTAINCVLSKFKFELREINKYILMVNDMYFSLGSVNVSYSDGYGATYYDNSRLAVYGLPVIFTCVYLKDVELYKRMINGKEKDLFVEPILNSKDSYYDFSLGDFINNKNDNNSFQSERFSDKNMKDEIKKNLGYMHDFVFGDKDIDEGLIEKNNEY